MYIMILFAIPGVPIRQTKIISVVPVTHPEKIRVVRLDLKLYFLPFLILMQVMTMKVCFA